MMILRRCDLYDVHLIKMQITRVTSRLWWTVPLDLCVWTFILDWRILKSCWSRTRFLLLLGQLLGALVFTDEEETERSFPGVPAGIESHLAQTVDVRTLLTRYLGVKSRERKASIPGSTAWTQIKPSFDRKFWKFCYLQVHITINIPFFPYFFTNWSISTAWFTRTII